MGKNKLTIKAAKESNQGFIPIQQYLKFVHGVEGMQKDEQLF